jgi:hypothetical protein
VLVNGREAGTHFDAYLPFELDVTDLVRRGADNELLVGVRARSLFDLQSERYPRMRAPYPCGSTTDRLVGIGRTSSCSACRRCAWTTSSSARTSPTAPSDST